MSTTPEGKFQQEVIKWLKSKNCLVIKYEQNATTRAGVPDVFFFKEQFYGALECKRSKNAKLRPGQREYIKKFDEWSYGKIIYPENWGDTKEELEYLLK